MDKDTARISVIGLGYIGLPTAAIIASRGFEVIGIDVDQHAVDTINAGKVHIVEPDLDIVVRAAVTTGKLKAAVDIVPADAFLIAVPTPMTTEKKPDLSHVIAAAKSIAPVLEMGNLIILESTVPPGTTEMVSEELAKLRPDLTFPQTAGEKADISVAHCPERVLPGMVLQELVNNDRVVGGISKKCTAMAIDLYKIFVRGKCIQTNARTAEICKLTENANRDVNIAFANEMSVVCDEMDVNVWELIELANLHPRVNILQPGPGVGGHCIAVDPWFLVDAAPESTRLIQAARAVNDHKPLHVLEKIKQKADRFKHPRIACFGLSFKANIDDLRESPAMKIVELLARDLHCELLVVEPHITKLPPELGDLDHVILSTVTDAIQHADIILGLVDHDEFRDIHAEKLKDKVLIDTRGIWH